MCLADVTIENTLVSGWRLQVLSFEIKHRVVHDGIRTICLLFGFEVYWGVFLTV